jgi:outer membrane protein TolC
MMIFFLLEFSHFSFTYCQINNSVAYDSEQRLQLFTTHLSEFIDLARTNNPLIKAANSKIKAAFASVMYQRSLDAPQVGIEFMQSPVRYFPIIFMNQMEVDYSIQQMVPFPGKRNAMANAEQKRKEMLDMDKSTLEQDIIRSVKSAYYELYLIYRKMELNSENQILIKNFEEIARKQYEIGLGKQADVLRAQTELASLANEEIILKQNLKSAEAMINVLCNRPVTMEVGFILEIEPKAVDFNLDDISHLSEIHRPELKSMELNTQMKKAELYVAQREYYPDFMVRGMYRSMMDNRDDWALMVGITLPIAPWSSHKFSSAVEKTNENVFQSEFEYNYMKNMVSSQVLDALTKINSSYERLTLNKLTVIPKAQQTLESAIVSYQTGKQDFMLLIDIERMLIMAKQEYQMAVMNFFYSQAQLERAVGLSIEEMEKYLKGEYK